MKKIHSLVFVALASSTALAADLPSKKNNDVSPIMTIMNNWTGAYVGFDAGWVFGSFKDLDNGANWVVNEVNTLLNSHQPLVTNSANAFEGGLYGGYNYQINNIVTGVEVDINFGSLNRKDSATFNITGNGHTATAGLNGSQAYENGGSLRARMGYSFGSILPYLTAGLAMANEQFKVGGGATYDGTQFLPNAYSKSLIQYGYVLGGGIDYSLTNNIIARFEYLNSEFGKAQFGGTSYNLVRSVKYSSYIQQVRAGLAYKF